MIDDKLGRMYVRHGIEVHVFLVRRYAMGHCLYTIRTSCVFMERSSYSRTFSSQHAEDMIRDRLPWKPGYSILSAGLLTCV